MTDGSSSAALMVVAARSSSRRLRRETAPIADHRPRRERRRFPFERLRARYQRQKQAPRTPSPSPPRSPPGRPPCLSLWGPGGYVPCRAKSEARPRVHRLAPPIPPREPKAENLDKAGTVAPPHQHHILRLEIAVHDALRMRLSHGVT